MLSRRNLLMGAAVVAGAVAVPAGFTLAQSIQEDPALAGTTLLMLSSAEGSAARARDMSIAACLMKPIKQSELLDAIMSLEKSSDAARDLVGAFPR